MFSVVTLFKYNVSTILSPIVGIPKSKVIILETFRFEDENY